MPNVAVVGSASWGTALSIVLARKGVHVKLWTRSEEEAKHFNKERENPKYLPGFKFPRRLSATDSMEQALKKADAVVLAVPAQRMRENVQGMDKRYCISPIASLYLPIITYIRAMSWIRNGPFKASLLTGIIFTANCPYLTASS